MGSNPSFRLPAMLPPEVAHPLVIQTLGSHDRSITNINQALSLLATKVGVTPTIITSPAATSVTTASGTTIIESAGVSSFNALTGAVIYFPSLGTVNNQTGVTAYTTLPSDNGALVVVNDASPVAITLGYVPATPYFVDISNQGTITATITPTQGTINGLASITLAPGGLIDLYFDGTNWESSQAGAAVGGVTQIIAGTNVTISPPSGLGIVTINASAVATVSYHLVTSASYSATATDRIIGVNFAGAVTITLVSTASVPAGTVVIVKDESGNAGTNNITINPQGGQTIEGVSDQVIVGNYDLRQMYSNGSNWFLL